MPKNMLNKIEKYKFLSQYEKSVSKEHLELIWEAKESKATKLDLITTKRGEFFDLGFKDLSPLTGLVDLKELHIKTYNAPDFSPLKNLTQFSSIKNTQYL
jgi:hypothetical protein